MNAYDKEVHLELAFLAQGEEPDPSSSSVPICFRAADTEPEQLLWRAATARARFGPLAKELLGHINRNAEGLCIDPVDAHLDVSPQKNVAGVFHLLTFIATLDSRASQFAVFFPGVAS